MLHSINEIAISLGVSKMTIYRKLKVKELKSHIILKQGIQYIDDNGLTMLMGMLKPSQTIT
jgi:DeoR/GlpR family transcriptional regulator of sugar metabolism